MFDINSAVLTELGKNSGVTAYRISMRINSSCDCNLVSREDVSKALQSLKRKGLASNSSSVWNHTFERVVLI